MTTTPQERLPLVDVPAPSSQATEAWRLDERTREVGRRGLAQARAALAAAAARAASREEQAHRHAA